ncbi:hypothetical protein [Bifidobacterium callimiconis]|uniref:Uncharacterized protein n=1 Tax=Bifidobacterium callimiconis TaxID=2306973 RepID=A0A430FBR1_9BIFI|nr:hypothetical protein [Bifidobacterium callimiconis]RSX50269.1 hypothetical protein D2E23_1817 [Bifidobacterium callimiconis]
MQDIAIETIDETTHLVCPFNPRLPRLARRHGGVHQRTTDTWTWPASQIDKAILVADLLYGYDPNDHRTVTININPNDHRQGPRVVIAGRKIIDTLPGQPPRIHPSARPQPDGTITISLPASSLKRITGPYRIIEGATA